MAEPIATDGRGVARAVLQTTTVRVGPLSAVGEASCATKARVIAPAVVARRPRDGLCRYLATIGVQFDPDMSTVFERFDETD